MIVRGPSTSTPLALVTGLIAVSALAGVLGVSTGLLPVSPARQPFDSRVGTAIALALVVALPATVLSVLSHRGHRLARRAEALTRPLFAAWVVTEVEVLRGLAPWQVLSLLAALWLILPSGRRATPRTTAGPVRHLAAPERLQERERDTA